MSQLLAHRDTLAAALAEHHLVALGVRWDIERGETARLCRCGVDTYWKSGPTFEQHVADALFASGAVRDAASLPDATTKIEYAIADRYRSRLGDGFVKIVGLSMHKGEPRWNESITAQEAIDRWFPGGVVVQRTVTTLASTATEWEPAAALAAALAPTEEKA